MIHQSNITYKKGAVSSSLLSIIAKVLAFLQQLCIVFFYGANISTDIHFYLYNLAILIGGMIQLVTSSILIPRSMGFRINDSPVLEMKYLNSFLYIFISIGVIIALILAGIGENVLKVITHFSTTEIDNNLLIYYLFLPATILISINSFISEILVSYKYFSFPILFNIGLNSSIIISIILFRNLIGASSMMFGACFLASISTIFFIYCLKRKLQWSFFVCDFSMIKSSLLPIGGLILNQCLVIIVASYPLYLLSQFQVGAISLVNYAMKFVQAPYALMQQIAVVLQVKLNELKAQQKLKELYQITAKVANYVFVFGICIALIIFFFRYLIVDTLYGLGKLSESAMEQLATIIGIVVFSLPIIGAGQVWVKLYFSSHRIRLYISIMSIVNIISCGIYYILIQYYDVIGYAIAYAITESLMAISLWYKIRHSS